MLVVIVLDSNESSKPSKVYGPFTEEQDAVDWCWKNRNDIALGSCEIVELTTPEIKNVGKNN